MSKYIGKHVEMSGGAKVQGDARVTGRSSVGNDAVIAGRARVKNSVIGKDVRVGGASRVENSWVIFGDTTVTEEAEIVRRSHIKAFARVSGKARIEMSSVGGEARISGDTLVVNCSIHGAAKIDGLERTELHDLDMDGGEITGGVWKGRGPIYIQGSRHLASNSQPGYIKIGCQLGTFEYWLKNYEALGKLQSYSPEEIEEYGNIIAFIVAYGRGIDE